MPRHFNFRYDGDKSLRSIINHVFDLLLSIETSRTLVIVSFSRISTNDGSISECTNFSKAWIFFDFYSPSLVLGKMPVEIIHFVQREVVNVFLNKINWHEV